MRLWIVSLLLCPLVSSCGYMPTYQIVSYEYIVPPIAQFKGEHQTISLNVEGEKLDQPESYPTSEKLRLSWVKDINQADIQVFIRVKQSRLVHTSTYYDEATEYRFLDPKRALYRPRLKAHIQTDYEVEIRDRNQDIELLLHQGGRQFYFESPEGSSLDGSEMTLVDLFYQHEQEARNEVLAYLWYNMKGDRYSLLGRFKSKFKTDQFRLLKEHHVYSEFNQSITTFNVENKKAAAQSAKTQYENLVNKLESTPEDERVTEHRLLLRSARQGLEACIAILDSPYEPRLPYNDLGHL